MSAECAAPAPCPAVLPSSSSRAGGGETKAEWTDPYNSFNSWKGLMYYAHYQGIVEGRLLPPVEASIDPSYVCNLDCTWCNSQRILHDEGKLGHRMAPDHLALLCDFLADWGVRGFCFAGGGEPTLHPSLWAVLRRLKERGRESAIITNGIEIREEEKRHTAVDCTRWMGISLDAGNRTTYSRTKRSTPSCFDQILENVQAMVEYKRQTGSRCEIAIKYLIHPSNQGEILQACRVARDLGVDHFHARPAASENIEGLGEVLEFSLDVVNEQLEECLKLQTSSFKVFGVRHKFTSTMNMRRGFSRCWAAPLAIQCGADGVVYHCVDWRGDKRFALGRHHPDPREILSFWGSEEHLRFLREIDVTRCPRCTYGVYSEQIENAVIGDGMCVNFP